MKLKKLTKIEEDVIGHLGGILSALFGSLFGCNFHLFLDSARSVSCLFYCTFCPSGWIWGPFLDLFWTVLFITRRFVSLLGLVGYLVGVFHAGGGSLLKVLHVSGGRKSGMPRGGSPLGSSRIMILWFGTGDMCLTGGVLHL